MKRTIYCIMSVFLLMSFGVDSAKAQGRTYPEPVDMGLSVLWGDQNVVNQYFITQLYYWGGGNGITLRGEEYPSNICSTEYDIATQLYGNGWRMPTADEYRELCEKCSYKCTSDGITFTASNGNSITLPNVGYRYLNMLKNDYTYYWTGTQGFYGFGVLSLYGIDAGSGISWNSINTVINPPRDGVKYYTRFSPDAFGFNSTGIKDKDNICYYLYSDEYQCAIRPVKDRSEPEAIPYAILNNGTLTFYYDSSYNSREGTYYDMDGIRPVRANGLQYNMYLWYDNADDIKTAVFDSSFAGYRPTSRISLLFWQCHNLERITGFENLNMENVTEMNYMFYGCGSLTTLDLSSLNTSNVTGMKNMFNSCSKLKTIYVGSQWSTTNVTSSDGMFYNCQNLVGGKGTRYDSNKTDKTYAHIDGGTSNPGYLTDKSSVTPYAVLNNGTLTFYYDNKKSDRMGTKYDVNGPYEYFEPPTWYFDKDFIKRVVVDPSMSYYNLKSTSFWFLNLREMTSVEGLSNLNTSGVKDMYGMFYGCKKIKSLDMKGFNTANVSNMSHMFNECEALESLDLSCINVDNVEDLSCTFLSCTNLKKLNLHGFNTSKVTNMNGFVGLCPSLKTIDLSSFNTANVTNMGQMFYGCPGLTTIYVGKEWKTDKVEDGANMFTNSTSLVGGAGTRYNPNHTDHEYARIDGGTSRPGYLTEGASYDVNGDGNLDVADIATIIDVMAGKCDTVTRIRADVNGDGSVDVADISTIISIMAASARLGY